MSMSSFKSMDERRQLANMRPIRIGPHIFRAIIHAAHFFGVVAPTIRSHAEKGRPFRGMELEYLTVDRYEKLMSECQVTRNYKQ